MIRKWTAIIFCMLIGMAHAQDFQKLDVKKTHDKIKQLQNDGLYKQAESLAIQLIMENPNNVDAQVQLAYVYYQNGDYASSKTILKGAEKYYPNDPDIPELLTLIYKKEQNLPISHKNEINPALPGVMFIINQNRPTLENKATKTQAQMDIVSSPSTPTQANTPSQTNAQPSAESTGQTNAPTEIPKNATVFSPSNLQATNILNNIVAEPTAMQYGPNQLGLVQQSIYGTSPYSYWDFTNLYYTRATDFGMILGSLNYASRFGMSAFQGAAEGIINFSEKFYLDVNLAYANNLNLFPDWTVGAEGYISVLPDLQVSFGDLYKAVTPRYFNTYTFSLQKYYADYLFIFRPYFYVPNTGEDSILYTVSARKYFDSTDHNIVVTLGYGITPDLADLQSIDFITIKQRSVAVDYQFPLMNHRLVADVGLSYENQRFPSGFIRQLSGINAGLRARF